MLYTSDYKISYFSHHPAVGGNNRITSFEQVPPHSPFDRNATYLFLASLRKPNLGVDVHLNRKDSKLYEELEDNFIIYQAGIVCGEQWG